jgi:hypothetical protein
MPGVLLQLTGIGLQDAYLTENPEINVFKYRYFRYLNFATEIFSIPLSNISDFGKSFFAAIPLRGHLLSKLFLKIRLPSLQKKDGTFACWTNGLGYALIDFIEFEINGITYEKLYGYFLDMYDELTTNPTDYGKRNMILKTDNYYATRQNANRDVELMIPLSFWFTKQPNLAIPIHLFGALTQIKVNFKFRRFEELIHYDGLIEPDPVGIRDIELFGEYIYLDEPVLNKVFPPEPSTKFLISQLQSHEREFIGPDVSTFMSELKFNNTVSELIFAFVEKDSLENNDLFNYSDRIENGPLVESLGLVLDGQERFPMLPESYFRLAVPKSIHSFVPTKYVYCIPFSNRPEYNQPTGSLNFSRFDVINLKLQKKNNGRPMYLYVFATNYNLMTIESGGSRLDFGV